MKLYYNSYHLFQFAAKIDFSRKKSNKLEDKSWVAVLYKHSYVHGYSQIIFVELPPPPTQRSVVF